VGSVDGVPRESYRATSGYATALDLTTLADPSAAATNRVPTLYIVPSLSRLSHLRALFHLRYRIVAEESSLITNRSGTTGAPASMDFGRIGEGHNPPSEISRISCFDRLHSRIGSRLRDRSTR
jgi:hypothetical protein